MAKKELPDEGPSLEMPSLGSLFKRGRKKATKEDPRVDADQQPSAEDFERLVRGPKHDEPAVAKESAAADEVAGAEQPAEEELVEEEPLAEEHLVEEELVEEEQPAAEEPLAEEQPVAEVEQPDEPVGAPSATPAAETEQAEVISELPEHDLIAEAEEPDLADIEDDDVSPDDDATDEGDQAEAATDEVDKTAVAEFRPIPPAPEKPLPQDGASAARPTAALSTTGADPVEGESAVEEPARSPRSFTLPALPGIAAASVTGVLVGILAVALTYFGLRGCEAIRGTSTCGGPGIQILIVNMIILIVVGSVLLKAWKVTDPTSTSFLAVGLLAVISLLFLIEVIFSPAMLVVIPLVSAGTYALSQWVTERFIDDE